MGLAERRQRCRELIQRHYRDVPTREEMLDRALGDLLRPEHVLLDAGCGSRLPLLSRYGPKVALSVGVDLCSPAADLSPVGNVVVGDLETLPLRTGSFDLVISRSVLEHLRNPIQVFREFGRILRPQGRVVFTTPNKYYYSCLVARVTPDFLKDRYFRAVFGEEDYDHFPVHYRANTVRAFRRLAQAADLKIKRIEPIRHYPYYLVFSPPLFRLGIFYDRLITRLRMKWLQSNWLVVMEKRE